MEQRRASYKIDIQQPPDINFQINTPTDQPIVLPPPPTYVVLPYQDPFATSSEHQKLKEEGVPLMPYT